MQQPLCMGCLLGNPALPLNPQCGHVVVRGQRAGSERCAQQRADCRECCIAGLYQLARQRHLLLAAVYAVWLQGTDLRQSHPLYPGSCGVGVQHPGRQSRREMSMVSQAAGGLESSITSALSGVSAGGGNNELKTPGQRKTNLHFKYADAIGHPATSLIGGSIAGYSCRSAATPLCRISSAHWIVWHGVPVCPNRCTRRR